MTGRRSPTPHEVSEGTSDEPPAVPLMAEVSRRRFGRRHRRPPGAEAPAGAPNLPEVGSDIAGLPTGAEKRVRVREMFDTIAPRYDLINGLMTFGLDRHWRHQTIKLLDLSPPALVADLGCGTGDLGRLLRSRGHEAIGIDMSLGMLQASKPGGAPVVLADAAMMPLGDASIDGAVSGFALRNFAEIVAVIVEVARVVRPGGRVALLDVAQPENLLVRAGYSLWFNHAVPRIGSWLSDREAYRYLPRSVAYLPSYSELAGVLGDAGFTAMRRDLLSGGVVQIISATRAGSARPIRRQSALAVERA